MRWRGLAQPRGAVLLISQRLCTARPPTRARNAPSAPVDQITGWLGGSPRRRPRLSSLPTSPGFPLSRAAPSISSAGGSELSFHQMTGVSPSQRLKFSLRRVAQSFLLRTWLGVSPPPYTLKFSLRRWPEVPPCGFPPCRVAPGFPRDQRPQSLPSTGWPGVSPAPVARSFLLAGGAGLLLSPKARSCPLPGGSGFPLRRLPSLVVRKFLRLSPKLHKGFRAATSRFFRRPQAIHS
jgi:hypothetical protein